MKFSCVDCKKSHDKFSNCQIRCSDCTKKRNLLKVKLWYTENKQRKKLYDEQRRLEKRELFREASKRFRDNNPAKKKADLIARRSKIKQQTPAWANFKYMNIFYKIAKLEQERTGRKVHVDHIYPLVSDWVCGLHCEDNLQVMFAEDNIRKGNKPNHYSLEHLGIK